MMWLASGHRARCNGVSPSVSSGLNPQDRGKRLHVRVGALGVLRVIGIFRVRPVQNPVDQSTCVQIIHQDGGCVGVVRVKLLLGQGVLPN